MVVYNNEVGGEWEQQEGQKEDQKEKGREGAWSKGRAYDCRGNKVGERESVVG